jgi:Na+-translocating ferredoxin:NAD+ oxidoreductase RnfG subunit
MTEWLRWTAPAAVAIAIVSPAQAVQYLSVEQAQKLAFPSATHFAAAEGGRAWRAEAGGRLVGLFVVDHVIGKHLYIDYAVALDPGGRIHRVDILAYRESYGGEVRSPSWLAQFVGKTSGSTLKVGGDIRNISGATLSSLHVTEGVKRIVSAYGSRVR